MEQDSAIKTDLIDPDKLVVQEGLDTGRMNAFETEQGKALTDSGEAKDIPDSEQPYTVEGLPVIGAEAEDEKRAELNDIDQTKETYSAQAIEEMANDTGERAMARAVAERAIALIPGASEELKRQVFDAAMDKMLKEFENKRSEKQEAANSRAQELLDMLKSDKPLSEVDPSLNPDQIKPSVQSAAETSTETVSTNKSIPELPAPGSGYNP